ncbi:MAG TPA: hypothetical protein VMH91_00160 [Candidatus Paceibacterota bacterium]|nr:hypothetical protein [Candidatus Paceibacterota bacterium]
MNTESSHRAQPSRICQVGLGFVGNAVLRAFAARGLDAIGMDIAPEKVDALRAAGYRAHLATEPQWREADLFFVSVNTPADTAHKSGYDLRALLGALSSIAEVIRERKRRRIVVLRSTVSVGTTRDFLIPHLERQSGMAAGKEFGVVSNPEFLEEVNAEKDALSPPGVVYWASDEETDRAFVQTLKAFEAPFMRYDTPELTEGHKVMNNLLNATVISFFNEWLLHIRSHADIPLPKLQEMFYGVTETAFAKTRKKYGAHIMGAWGGGCLPKDVDAALTQASLSGDELPLTRAVKEVNEKMKAAGEDVRAFSEAKFSKIKGKRA